MNECSFKKQQRFHEKCINNGCTNTDLEMNKNGF